MNDKQMSEGDRKIFFSVLLVHTKTQKANKEHSFQKSTYIILNQVSLVSYLALPLPFYLVYAFMKSPKSHNYYHL